LHTTRLIEQAIVRAEPRPYEREEGAQLFASLSKLFGQVVAAHNRGSITHVEYNHLNSLSARLLRRLGPRSS
jgi:hypothetical protein